jgi:opacity protein-like surface antigen
MRTINRLIWRKFSKSLVAIVLVFAWTQMAGFLRAEETLPRFSLSLSAGCFFSQQKSFRQLYGSVQFPLNLEVNYVLSPQMDLFAGLRYLTSKGETEIVGAEFMPESHPIDFSLYSGRLGIAYYFLRTRLSLFMGAGLSYNFYKEKWENTEISAKDKKFGFFAQGGTEYSLGKRYSFVGRIEYSSIPTKESSKLQKKINLGGLEFSLGFCFRL